MRVCLLVSDLLKVPAGAATDGEQAVLIKTRLLITGRLVHNEVTECLEVAADVRTSEPTRVECVCVYKYMDTVAVATVCFLCVYLQLHNSFIFRLLYHIAELNVEILSFRFLYTFSI